MPAPEEFYVGYLPKSPRALGSRTRIVAALLLVAGVTIGLALVAAQDRFDEGSFEFGIDREFEGVLLERPYPILLQADGTTHYLAAVGKRGAAALVEGLAGRSVVLTGSAISNDSQRMIEVHDVRDLGPYEGRMPVPQRLGTMTLTGEIVDSKCHLGVMKPGRGKPHKACAIRCISGGIPPVLRVEDSSGKVEYLLLVDHDGNSVNDRVLDMIAEPVEITGEVARNGGLLVMFADPATYRRVGS